MQNTVLMNRITTFILLLIWGPLAMRAQTILDKKHNLPLAGDDLYKVSVVGIDYTSKVIDLTDKVLDSNLLSVKYLSKGEASVQDYHKIADGGIFDFSFVGEKLFLNGYENNQLKVVFLSPIMVCHFPFVLGDSLGCSFKGTGMYVDKIPYSCMGECCTKYHSLHTLVTPNGDSIQSVYTLSHIKKTLYKMENDEGGKYVVMEILNSYAVGYRYPILETITYYEGRNPVSSLSYYYPIDKQPYLEHDVANREYRRKLTENANGSETENNERLMDYDFSFQPTSQQVSISFSTFMDCEVDFVLVSVDGIVYQRQTKHVQAHEQNSLSLCGAGLPHGQYAVYISVGNEKHTEKFNIK